jgi:putative phosphoribosyl transferase
MSEQSEVEVDIPVGRRRITGSLALPHATQSLVIFAHGSGSSRWSPRNRFVAEVLQQAGFGTLLLDLLTPDEERRDEITGQLRFDIDLLAERLTAATDWAASIEPLRSLRQGYFGASTGAAAALVAAASRPDVIGAVLSRGGRPDLAGAALPRVAAPTLLIVGSRDVDVLELNQEAFRMLGARDKALRVVPGATHLFEESGALEEVATLARRWFEEFLVPAEEARPSP